MMTRGWRCGLPLAEYLCVAEPRTEGLCQDWEALKRAAPEQEIVFEFDGHQIHVWLGRPQPGDSCACGAWTW
jgi:hypothetical protein